MVHQERRGKDVRLVLVTFPRVMHYWALVVHARTEEPEHSVARCVARRNRNSTCSLYEFCTSLLSLKDAMHAAEIRPLD